MIRQMTEADIETAATVYSLAWVDSHRAVCSETVLKRHSPQKKAEDLKQLLGKGWRFWLYETNEALCGLVGMHAEKGEIAYLYVLPQEQGKGIGGSLLQYACGQIPKGKRIVLWTLNTNIRAEAIYAHYGFVLTGNARILNENTGLSEREWTLPQ